MNTLKDLVGIFFLNSKLRIQRNMQYRFDFFNGLVMSLLNSGIGVVVLFLIFTTTNGYPGWNLQQIFLFQGLLLLWNGLKNMFFGDVRANIDDMVRKGNFDRLLLKPYPPIGLILVDGPNYMSLSGIAAGLFIIVVALMRLHIVPSIQSSLACVLFLISAVILHMAFLVLYCLIAIMVVFTGRMGEVMDKILRFSEYPIEIYGRGVSWILRYVFPLAVMIYLPTQALLGRIEIIALISALVCVILFFLSLQLWKHGLNKYTSTGG